MSRVDVYMENAKTYCTARVEVWPDKGLPDIYVFPFADVREFLIFETWLAATIDMITGKDHARDRVFRRAASDSESD